MQVNLIAIIPLAIIGSLLHFVDDWSRHNRVVAVFAAVNESYWEPDVFVDPTNARYGVSAHPDAEP